MNNCHPASQNTDGSQWDEQLQLKSSDWAKWVPHNLEAIHIPTTEGRTLDEEKTKPNKY